MRAAPIAIAAALVACTCQPPTPLSVTFRIKNPLTWPVFVADGQEQAGIIVQRPVAGGWADVAESLTCECLQCSQVCQRSCTCPLPPGMVRQVRGGEQHERSFAGEYRDNGSRACLLGNVGACLESPTVVSAGDALRAKWCFANRLASPPPAEARFPGSIPESGAVCVTREFTLPVSGVIELSPPEPTTCASTAECRTAERELCQSGLCSTTCLPSSVPPVGGSWTVEVLDPDNQGFFQVQEPATPGRVTYAGRGTVGAVRYETGSVRLTFVRDDPQLGRVTGALYLALPGGRAVPMNAGDPVEVTVVVSTDRDRPGARGAVLRRSGVTLLVADAGRGGPVLAPDDMQPFSVAAEGEEFACDPGNCGRKVHREMTLTAAGQSAVLRPGTPQKKLVGGYRYELVPVANYRYDYEGCGKGPVTPFAIVLDTGT